MTVVTGGLITLEYALEGLGYGPKQPLVDGALSARDADVAAYIQAATSIIESLVGPVASRPTTITRTGGGKSAVLLPGPIADASAVTAVRVDGTAVNGWTVDVAAGIVRAATGTTFDGSVQIDLTTGYTVVPQALQLATRELVRYWIQIGKQSPAAGVLNIPGDNGDSLDPYAIPRRVRQLCGPFASGGFA